MLASVVLCVEVGIEIIDFCTTGWIRFSNDMSNVLAKPSVELSDFHVVVEIDVTDIGDSLKGLCSKDGIREETGICFNNVK